MVLDAEAGVAGALRELATAPAYDERLQLYRTAFIELQTERPITMAGQALIPWSRIKDWALFYSIPDPEEFISIIQMLDATDLRTRKAPK